MEPPCLFDEEDGTVRLEVTVQPRAKRSGVQGIHNNRLKVRLQCPPVEGKANRELLQVLRRALGIPKSSLQLVAGERSRDKTIRLYGVKVTDAAERLGVGL